MTTEATMTVKDACSLLWAIRSDYAQRLWGDNSNFIAAGKFWDELRKLPEESKLTNEQQNRVGEIKGKMEKDFE